MYSRLHTRLIGLLPSTLCLDTLGPWQKTIILFWLLLMFQVWWRIQNCRNKMVARTTEDTKFKPLIGLFLRWKPHQLRALRRDRHTLNSCKLLKFVHAQGWLDVFWSNSAWTIFVEVSSKGSIDPNRKQFSCFTCLTLYEKLMFYAKNFNPYTLCMH